MAYITHKAEIISIKDQTISLKFAVSGACQGCAAKNFCISGEPKERIIEVEDSLASNFRPGDEALVAISLTSGIKAVVYAYILPLLLLLFTIIGLKIMGYDDFKSGISGIIVLIPHYFVLFLMRNKIKSGISFKIIGRKTDE